MAYKFTLGCLKCSLLASMLLFFQPLTGQYNLQELDKLLDQKQPRLGKEFVVMLWAPKSPEAKGADSLIYKKESGGMKSRTQVPIASCSKWLTAALVMQFVDEGKISLDDPVVNYLPVFEKYFKKYITIRHCLSHMSGIADDDKLIRRLLQRKKFSSLQEEVESIAARDIRANAGTDFWYGNIGLTIAARVLEVVSKRNFDVLIRQKLFTPLGMRNTTFSTLDGSPPNPAGGARSTAEDYMKFLVMLLHKGNYNGKQILSKEAVEEMMKIQTTPAMIRYAPKSAEGFNYALGSWVIESSPPAPTHGGGIATVLASPGLFGTWPMIDFCRGYAYLFFVKNFLGEDRADAQLEIKNVIDAQMKNNCK